MRCDPKETDTNRSPADEGEYVREVRNREFPKPEHTYKMVEGELPRLEKLLKKKET